MPNWEAFTKKPFRRGGNKTIATLTGDARRPILLIGALLREQGFDVTKSYELLWDAKASLMGLRPSNSVNAFKVGKQRNSSHSSVAHSVQAIGFCRHFKIDRRMTATRARQDTDGTWVLHLSPIRVTAKETDSPK